MGIAEWGMRIENISKCHSEIQDPKFEIKRVARMEGAFLAIFVQGLTLREGYEILR